MLCRISECDSLRITMLKKIRLPLFIFFLVFLCSCVSNTTIVNSVTERDANEIVVFLASKGIQATREVAPSGGGAGGSAVELWNVSVDASQAVEAMALLNKNGLPRQQGQDLLSLFGETGLVPTDMQQKIRYQAGLAQQIANTILKIDGVLDASVQISSPPDGSLEPITASVYVKHQGVLDNPNSQLIIKIKQLVAGAVAGLKLENVTVITDKSRFTETPSSQLDTSFSGSSEYVSVWGVNVTRDSLFMFRVIFFALCFLVLVLIGIVGWIVWRLMPLLNEKGGIAYLWQIGKVSAALAPIKEEKPEQTPPSSPSAPPPSSPPPQGSPPSLPGK